MAINDPNYRYATQTWEADGVRTDYEIAFDGGYIRQSDVVAFSVLVDADTGLVSGRTVHTLTFVDETLDPEGWAISAHVRITPAVATGRRVVIFRSTEKSEPMVNYEDDSILTERNLDLANKQAIFGIAEIMDGLNTARIDIDSQVQQVIDMNELITSIYNQVIELIAAGGIVSVAPRVFAGVGDGEATDFIIAGADVFDAAFYDTAVAGNQIQPIVDYTIQEGDSIAETSIRFTTPVADGAVWFTVLRGYARPYTGPSPVTDLRIPVIPVTGTEHFVDKSAEFSLLDCTNDLPVSVTVNAIGTPTALTMRTGSYFSAVQSGDGQVTLIPDADVVFQVPEGYLPKTRIAGSTISAVCKYADGEVWSVSGDLALEV